MSIQTVFVPTADVLDLLFGDEGACADVLSEEVHAANLGVSSYPFQEFEPEGGVQSVSKLTDCSERKHQQTRQEYAAAKFTLEADVIRDGLGKERQKSRQHEESSSSSSYSSQECHRFSQQYSFSQVEQHEQQNYTVDDVKIIAQSINEAVARLELDTASHSMASTSVMSLVTSPALSWNTFTQSLDAAINFISIDDRLPFVVMLGRALLAQCKESCTLIRSFIKQYTVYHFGAQLRVPIVSKNDVSSDGTPIN